MIYAHIEKGVIRELVTPLEGFTIAQCYPSAFVNQCQDVTNVTPAPQVGWGAVETNGVWAYAPPVAPPPPAIPLKVQAQSALDASDITVLRCVEVNIPVPADWAAYRVALRAVVAGTSTTMPTQPPYPAS